VVAGGNAVVDIHALLASLEGSGLATRIRDSLFIFPLLESIHVIGLTLVFGTILILDLRLLGLASTGRSVQRIASEILTWTWAAFALTAVTGALMFITNAAVYYDNVFFRAKAALLVLAGINMVVFEVTDRRKIHDWDRAPSAPPAGRLVAVLSLLIWVAIIVAGRMIGFTTSRATTVAPAPADVNFEDVFGAPTDPGSPATPPAK
jgi:uncharacterized protein DUF6644